MRAHEDKYFVKSGDLSSNITTNQKDVYYLEGFSLECAISGSPVGELKIQILNDVPNAQWTDIEESKATINGAEIIFYNVRFVYYRFFRLIYTRTSGSGFLSVRYIGKGV